MTGLDCDCQPPTRPYIGPVVAIGGGTLFNIRAYRTRRRGFCAAAAACLLSAAGAAGQTTVRWAGPVNGDYADPTKWAGPVPEGGEYDPVIDAAGNGTRYYVNIPGGTPRTTGHLTVSAADAQLAVFGPLNAVRGVDLVSGSIALYYDARLSARYGWRTA